MPGQFRKVCLVALALGLGAPASSALAQTSPGIDTLTADTHLGRPPGNVMIPGDLFNPGDLFFPRGLDGPMSPTLTRSFASQGITTVGDLIAADPQLVGRLMEIDEREAQMMQRHLRETISQR